jgi:hypothetical protein
MPDLRRFANRVLAIRERSRSLRVPFSGFATRSMSYLIPAEEAAINGFRWRSRSIRHDLICRSIRQEPRNVRERDCRNEGGS